VKLSRDANTERLRNSCEYILQDGYATVVIDCTPAAALVYSQQQSQLSHQPQVATVVVPPPQPPPAPHPSLPTPDPNLKLLEILKSAFYQTINELDQASITQITNRIDPVAADIETSIEVLNNNEYFKTSLLTPIWDHLPHTTGVTVGNYVTTTTLTKARSALEVGVGVEIPLPTGTTIESICKRWFSNMIYDYFDIKLTINNKQQISTNLHQELSSETNTEADKSAINQAGQKIASEISNLTQLISSVTLEKDGQMATNPLTTLQAMIKNANLFIFLPMVNSLTTKMGPEVVNISCIDYIDDIIFYLEQFITGVKDNTLGVVLQDMVTKIYSLIPQVIQTLQLLVLTSIQQYATHQMGTIPFISEALSALPIEDKSGPAPGFDQVAANITLLDAFITQLSTHINAGWEIVKEIISIKHNEQVRDALNILGQTLVSQPLVSQPHIDQTSLQTIPFISEALSALPEAIKSGDHANVFDNVFANIQALSDFITQLSTHINTGWAILKPHVAQTQPIEDIIEPIERNEQIRDALTKLKELIVGVNGVSSLAANIQTFITNIGSFAGSPTDIQFIQTSLILPLKLVQTCLTDTFTSNLKTAVDTALDTAVATASTQGGGKRNHKRKSGGYRKTIRRNHKRIIRVAKGGAATYRKKHNKSRKHKTRKRKIRKHKTRKHKRL
jgi:hypothetical protein